MRFHRAGSCAPRFSPPQRYKPPVQVQFQGLSIFSRRSCRAPARLSGPETARTPPGMRDARGSSAGFLSPGLRKTGTAPEAQGQTESRGNPGYSFCVSIPGASSAARTGTWQAGIACRNTGISPSVRAQAPAGYETGSFGYRPLSSAPCLKYSRNPPRPHILSL